VTTFNVKLTPKIMGENEPEVPYTVEWPSAIEAVEHAIGAVAAPGRWQTATIETGHGALQAVWDGDSERWTMIRPQIVAAFAAVTDEAVPQIMADTRLAGGWAPCSCPVCGARRCTVSA
jgi:hypothetical protein